MELKIVNCVLCLGENHRLVLDLWTELLVNGTEQELRNLDGGFFYVIALSDIPLKYETRLTSGTI